MSAIRQTAATLVCAALLCSTAVTGASASASEGASGGDAGHHHPADGLAIVADIVLARPIGLAVGLVGTAVFVVAVPFAAAAGELETVGDRLVVEPFEYTFTRPLGHFHSDEYSY